MQDLNYLYEAKASPFHCEEAPKEQQNSLLLFTEELTFSETIHLQLSMLFLSSSEN